MTVAIVIGFVSFTALVLGLIVYGVMHRDKGALPQVLVWKRDRIPITISPDPDALESVSGLNSALMDAISWWNRNSNIELFMPLGCVSRNGCVVPVLFGWPESESDYDHAHAVGSTRLTFDREGAIVSAAVYVNPDGAGYDGMTLRRAMTHELGHVLGLEHDEIRDSVMYSKAVPDVPVLTEKDRALLLAAYGDEDSIIV